MKQRTIKFRAWHPEKKKMFDVAMLQFKRPDGSEVFEPSIELLDWDRAIGVDEFVCNVEVMQFTGLLDKNGKEIYDGDVLKDAVTGDHYDGYTWSVVWDDYNAHYSLYGIKEDGMHAWIELRMAKYGEIIGNIYENPELLKS